jgi:hypothetical protein
MEQHIDNVNCSLKQFFTNYTKLCGRALMNFNLALTKSILLIALCIGLCAPPEAYAGVLVPEVRFRNSNRLANSRRSIRSVRPSTAAARMSNPQLGGVNNLNSSPTERVVLQSYKAQLRYEQQLRNWEQRVELAHLRQAQREQKARALAQERNRQAAKREMERRNKQDEPILLFPRRNVRPSQQQLQHPTVVVSTEENTELERSITDLNYQRYTLDEDRERPTSFWQRVRNLFRRSAN